MVERAAGRRLNTVVNSQSPNDVGTVSDAQFKCWKDSLNPGWAGTQRSVKMVTRTGKIMQITTNFTQDWGWCEWVRVGAGEERSRAHHQCRCGQWALFRFDPARNTQEESVSGPRMRPLFHCPQRAMKGGGVLELQTKNDCTDICMCPSIMLPAPITFSEAPKTLNWKSRSKGELHVSLSWNQWALSIIDSIIHLWIREAEFVSAKGGM